MTTFMKKPDSRHTNIFVCLADLDTGDRPAALDIIRSSHELLLLGVNRKGNIWAVCGMLDLGARPIKSRSSILHEQAVKSLLIGSIIRIFAYWRSHVIG
jgi:hypothetical protein